MNFFDILFSVVIIGFLLFGFVRGSFREFLSFIGVALGYLGAERFHEQYVNITLQYINDIALAKIFTYFALFVAGIIIGIILSTLIKILISFQHPTFPSRILGALIGSLKGVLICLLILFLVEGFVPSFADELFSSFLTPWLKNVKDLMHGINIAFIGDTIPA